MVFSATPPRLLWASGIATAILLLQVSVAQEVHTGFPGVDQPQPSATECRAHIEAALKKIGHEEVLPSSSTEGGGSSEEVPADQPIEGEQVPVTQDVTSAEATSAESAEGETLADKMSAEETTPTEEQGSTESTEAESAESMAKDEAASQEDTSAETMSKEQEGGASEEITQEEPAAEASASMEETTSAEAGGDVGSEEITSAEVTGGEVSSAEVVGEEAESAEKATSVEEPSAETAEVVSEAEKEASAESGETVQEEAVSAEAMSGEEIGSAERATSAEEAPSAEEATSAEEALSAEEATSAEEARSVEDQLSAEAAVSVEDQAHVEEPLSAEEAASGEVTSEEGPGVEVVESESGEEGASAEITESKEVVSEEETSTEAGEPASSEEEEAERPPEEELSLDIEIPTERRNKDHIQQILQLDEKRAETDTLLSKIVDSTLKDLKRIYDNAIKPLEILYKYRDLSNRHFGDPEIFSKPLILFMGPWSGGKSTIINYLMDIEYTSTALRTGAEPSPAYFNILMSGDQEEILDGTQLAADWTFSGLQKFGQGLLDRLRGLRLPNKLLEKVNIVEIPGILEIRKQVERHFPFNDACQWFIDRADVIFLVYDPSKLDVGPETEAILDQLKGREYQVRMILNKADQVKPEELMRVQGTLIWNISPLMSSSEPPIMYSTSLWSLPYEIGAPTRLLYAQELAFLRDIRTAIDKRVENKIASARRFAVRVRNHAKMVDCYLTTYYNHKSIFGNKKKISDDIIEHPQNYHIYEGLSTLTNISRYDLPDPEVYRDFFKLNALYDFQLLSSTCTYFKGCPINKLDISIAYDLPELVGKYKRAVDMIIAKASKES